MTDTIDTIVNDMYDYQKKNNISAECLTNCQSLLDILRNSGVNNIESCACICVGDEGGKKKIIKKHMVLVLDSGRVIDSSFEVSSLENQRYYETYSAYQKEGYPSFEKDDIHQFIHFIDVSKKMNEGEFCRGENLDYYNKQLDYIMDHYLERKKGKKKVFWCEHEACLESTEPFSSEEELKEHTHKYHSPRM
jgi:hypothetical protein